MIITCEACGTSFRLQTSRVKETGSKVRCSKCRHVFVVYPPQAAAEADPLEAEGGSVEGTATMEFFGAIEEEARISQESARTRDAQKSEARSNEEDDTLSDLRAMIESENGQNSFSDFPDSGPAGDEAEVSLSELESSQSPEVVSPEFVPLEDLELTDFGGQAEPEEEPVDLGDLTVDTPPSPPGAWENQTLDFGELDAETADFGETAAEDSAAEEDLLDLSAFGQQASAVSRDAEADAGEAIDLSELEMTTGETLDFDKMEAAPSAGEEAFEDGSGGDAGDLADEELDLGDLAITAEEEEAVAEEEVSGKGGDDTDLDNSKTVRDAGEKESSGAAGDTKYGDEFGPDDAEGSPAGELDKEPDVEELELDLDVEKDLERELGLDSESADKEPFLSESVEAGGTEESESAEPDEDDWALNLDDLDLDTDEGSSTTPDLEEGEGSDEFELDLDFDSGGEAGGNEPSRSESGAAAATGDAASETLGSEDWELDVDEFDLDLETDEAAGQSMDLADQARLDEFELDLDFDDEEQKAPGAAAEESGEDDFELDFDLDDPGEVRAEAGQSLPRDDAGEEFELDLEPDEGTVAATETTDAAGGESEKTEEFDLSEIEDILDEQEPDSDSDSARSAQESTELDLDMETDDAGRTIETDTEPETAPATEEQELDLETMLDNEKKHWDSGEEELAMETVEEDRQAGAQQKDFEPAGAAAAPADSAAGAEEDDDDHVFAKDSDTDMPHSGYQTAFSRKSKSRARPFLIFLLVLILLAAVAAGGIYYFGLQDRIPFLGGSQSGSQGAGPVAAESVSGEVTLSSGPDYRFITNESAGELLVITGSVVNSYEHPRNLIKLKADLYDAQGEVIRSQSSYAGNVIPDERLKKEGLRPLQTELASRQEGSGAVVSPGKSVPFMVLFGNMPENMEEFVVEVVSSSRA
ncbi:MAG: DUF3426 domain-containing protein [Desulfosalsimonadaceae bacterium]